MSAFAVSSVWLLAVMTAIILCSRLSSVGAVLAVLASGLATLTALLLLVPRTDGIGFMTALVAGWRLVRPGRPAADRILAGICAGAAAALYAGSGISTVPASVLTFGVVGLAWWVSARPRFAPLPREPMLCLVALAAPVIGLTPDFVEGWHSAGLLNQPATLISQGLPAWTLALGGLALLAGACRGIWSRR